MPFTINDLTFSSGRVTLTRVSIAAVRSWLLGIDVDAIARRYFAIAGEAPRRQEVHRQILDLREQLIPICHQYGLVEAAIGLRNGPHGAESHRQAALKAVLEIEGKLVSDSAQLGPRAGQGIELWFTATLARRFQRAGLSTFQHVLNAFRDTGGGWWRRAPRIGEKTADVVLRWMMKQDSLASAPGMAELKAEYLPPSPALTGSGLVVLGPSSPMVPWERIKGLASSLDGSQGTNRGPRNRLSAQHDLAAINAWLMLFPSNSHTLRAYRKEAERFLLWAILERGQPLSSLTTEDAVVYRDFLENIPPHWQGHPAARNSPLWRPFALGKIIHDNGSQPPSPAPTMPVSHSVPAAPDEHSDLGQSPPKRHPPLSEKSRAHAVTILRSLCEWLMRRGYLDSNPWDGVPPIKLSGELIQISKAIPEPAWDTLVKWLDEKAKAAQNQQIRAARAAILLLRDSGLRRAEACSVRRQDLVYTVGGGADSWELTVLGKGKKIRVAPVSDLAVDALKAHFEDRRLDWDDAGNPPLLSPLTLISDTAQIRHAEAEAGYTPGSLYQMIKAVFKSFTEDRGNVYGRVEGHLFTETTVHDLRHTFGVHAVAAGVDLDVIQGTLGHSSLSTTTIYVQGDRVRRRSQIAGKLYRQKKA